MGIAAQLEEAMRPSARRGGGSTFYVHRIGDRGELDNSNAGDAQGITSYFLGREEKLMATGDWITTFKVITTAPFGEYAHYSRGKTRNDSTDRVGRRFGKTWTTSGFSYSFPKGGKWTAKRIGVKPTSDLGKALEKKAEELKEKGVIDWALAEDLPIKVATAVTKKLLEK